MKGTTTSAIPGSEAVNQPYLVVVGGSSAGNRAVLASLLKGLERALATFRKVPSRRGEVALVRLANGVTNAIGLELLQDFAAVLADVKSRFKGLVLAGGDKRSSALGHGGRGTLSRASGGQAKDDRKPRRSQGQLRATPSR
ncbi:MAG: hypothetical protein HGA75_18070, partial [Thiobacillus sp.]|nr:hypothetical protein [Thiobacillus sp.]